MKFLLANTPTSVHHLEIGEKDQPNAGIVTLSQTLRFDLLRYNEVPQVVRFLQEIQKDKSTRRKFDAYRLGSIPETIERFPLILEYNPNDALLHLFRFIHRDTEHEITLGYSVAWKILDALTGKTERLVREE